MQDLDNNKDREDLFSTAVRAGKRTYFFDVKATKSNEYFIAITESKRKFKPDGRVFYEKHKIFLYQEDFNKFLAGITDSIEFIKLNQPEIDPSFYNKREENLELSEIEYEDIDASSAIES